MTAFHEPIAEKLRPVTTSADPGEAAVVLKLSRTGMAPECTKPAGPGNKAVNINKVIVRNNAEAVLSIIRPP